MIQKPKTNANSPEFNLRKIPLLKQKTLIADNRTSTQDLDDFIVAE